MRGRCGRTSCRKGGEGSQRPAERACKLAHNRTPGAFGFADMPGLFLLCRRVLFQVVHAPYGRTHSASVSAT